MDCIFCKIVKGEIPCNKVFENDDILAFNDISPLAKTHIIVIFKKHIQSVADINSDNSNIISKIFEAISYISKQQKLDNGFRVITNSGIDAGQTVNHLHFHILGGEKLRSNII
jgi:histidine triad (HIT) family protein